MVDVGAGGQAGQVGQAGIAVDVGQVGQAGGVVWDVDAAAADGVLRDGALATMSQAGGVWDGWDLGCATPRRRSVTAG
ncbi:hypothetical protein GCM10009837_87350 [Streptomyces durmitorensis]